MSRYTGSSWKISRRLNYDINGAEDGTGKALAKRPYAPGMHGKKHAKLTEYGAQLQEKQKVRFTYGVNEKQFHKTFEEAGKMAGVHGLNFLRLLESRLDNIVFRLGFASTRAQARQLVNHGHITVDGKKVDIPSYRLVPGQVIALKESSKDLAIVKANLEAKVIRPDYVSYDENKKTGTFVRLPERNEFLPSINEQLIVEFYSR